MKSGDHKLVPSEKLLSDSAPTLGLWRPEESITLPPGGTRSPSLAMLVAMLLHTRKAGELKTELGDGFLRILPQGLLREEVASA